MYKPFHFTSALGAALLATDGFAAAFSQKLDIQLRADDRSTRDIRAQYRLRYYPTLTLDNPAWSLNSFIVTGNDFSSSHNTITDGEADNIYVRRLFVSYQHEKGKTEIGVIPTYKGRVSSSGLSKDGWIKGFRQVANPHDDHAFELVVGELNNTSPSSALGLADNIDYIEAEYSGRISAGQTIEFSIERMTGGNYVRSEYRYALNDEDTVFAELIRRLDEPHTKIVLGRSGAFQLFGSALSYFAHYSYVSDGFGPRAELTEDFLGTGHGASVEISSPFAGSPAEWFVRFDVVNSTERVLAGLDWSF